MGFGVVAGVALAEIVVRVFDIGPDTNVDYRENYRLSENPILQYELVPGSRDGGATISAAGLRDRDYALAKPSGVFRILWIGDSIVYGFGVAQNETVSEQLESILQSYAAPGVVRFEVLNLGVTGYNIDQVVENLRTRGLQYDPDLVLYGYCLNDPQEYSFELESLKAQLSQAQLSYRENLRRQGRRLVSRSRLVVLLGYARRARSTKASSTTAPRDMQWVALADGSYPSYFARLYSAGPGRDRLSSGIAALQSVCHEARVPLVAVLFPLFMDLQEYRLADVHEVVTRLFEARGIEVYDLLRLYSTMFRLHGSVFIFNALHPNPLGHRLAALALLQDLARDGAIPRSDLPPPTLLRSPEDRALAQVIDAAGSASPAPRAPPAETPQ